MQGPHEYGHRETRLGGVGLRICLVTPFSWSQPHDVNEHVAGAAAELRRLGHEVTVLAPSGRASDLIAGRRGLDDGARSEEHTSELQSHSDLVCRLLLEKKKKKESI